MLFRSKNLLETNNIDYEEFIEKFKIELLWNTLIYSMYKNQLNINTVEIESELKRRIEIEGLKREYNLSEIEIQYDKEKISSSYCSSIVSDQLNNLQNNNDKLIQ